MVLSCCPLPWTRFWTHETDRRDLPQIGTTSSCSEVSPAQSSRLCGAYWRLEIGIAVGNRPSPNRSLVNGAVLPFAYGSTAVASLESDLEGAPSKTLDEVKTYTHAQRQQKVVKAWDRSLYRLYCKGHRQLRASSSRVIKLTFVPA